MIVSGVKDYRVGYKSYQDWIVPRYAVLSIFFVGLVFVIVGFILLLISGGGGFASAGAVFLGLGLSLHVICLLLCLHAYCIRYIRDQSTQTKDLEGQPVKEVTTPAQVIVTSKPPQGVLRTGRSPSAEPKRVRLQAERDIGSSGGQSQGFSSGGQSQGFSSGGQSQGFSSGGQSQGFSSGGQSHGFISGGQSQAFSSGGQSQSQTTSLLTEKFPLRSPEWKAEQQKTEVKQSWSKADSGAIVENHYETLPLKVEPDPALSRRPGEVFSRSQEAEISRQMHTSQVVYPQQAQTISVTSFEAPPPPAYPPPASQATASSSSAAFRSASPSPQREYGQSILTSPFPLSGGQVRQSSERHYQTSYQSGGNVQHFQGAPQASSTHTSYHVTSDTRPIKIEQYYHTMPQQMTAHQRQMASEYHWADMGSYGPPPPGGKPSGQDMTFEDHRSSKMSLYDNLNGWTDGGATI